MGPGRGFHKASWVGSVGQLQLERQQDTEVFWRNMTRYPDMISRLKCFDGLSKNGKLACTYGIEEDKCAAQNSRHTKSENSESLTNDNSKHRPKRSPLFSHAYATALSCTCNAGYAKRPDGCKKCPPQSTNSGSKERCECSVGYHQHYNHDRDWVCKLCEVNTYGGGGVNETCTPCPTGTNTGERVGVALVGECCHNENEVEILGRCTNKFDIACLGIGVVMAGVLGVIVAGFVGGRRRRRRRKAQEEEEGVQLVEMCGTEGSNSQEKTSNLQMEEVRDD